MLQKQNISIPLNAAIDSKRDQQLTDAEVFISQENCRFYKTGALVKRNGFSLIDQSPSPDDSRKRVVTDNEQLFISSGGSTNSTISYMDTWAQLGESDIYTSVNGAQIRALEYFGGQGRCLGAWVDWYDGEYLITANQSFAPGSRSTEYPGLFIYNGSNHRSAPQGFGTLAGSDTVTVAKGVWLDKNGTKYAAFSAKLTSGGVDYIAILVLTADLQSVLIDTRVALGVTFTYPYEVSLCSANSNAYAVVAAKTGASSIRVIEFDETGILNSGTVTTTSPINGVGDITSTGTAHTIACYKNPDQYPIFLNIVPATFAINWTVTTDAASMSLGTLDASSRLSIWVGSTLCFAISTEQTTTNLNTMTAWALTSGGVSLKGSDYNVANLGRGYDENGVCIIPVETNYTNGPSRLGGVQGVQSIGIARITGSSVRYVGAGFYDRHYVASTILGRSNMTRTAEGVYAFTVLEPLRADITNGGVLDLAARATIAQVDITNSDSQYGSVVNIGDSLLSMDGMATFLDGEVQLPAGFYFKPWISAIGSTSGGAIAAGTYKFKGVFDYTDSQGNIVLSVESNEVSVTTTGAASSIALTVQVSNWLGPANITFYMTAASGGVFNAKKRISISAFASSATATIIDSADISNHPIIYTAGNILENDPPPPCGHAAIHNDRIWVAPQDERNKLYYSNRAIQGEYPSFSNDLFIELTSSDPATRDKLVGSGPSGDRLIILRDRSCYYVSGDGADLTGANSTLTIPELISRDIGCSEPKGIISTPVGLFFKSVKGIYIVTPGLSLEYIGAPVEAYNSEEIIQTALQSSRNIVLFATATRVMCYDYLLQRWSVDTISNVRDMAVWQDNLVVLKSDGSIQLQDSSYLDVAAVIPMKVATGWMKLTGIQDYSRVWRALILGTYYSAHTLTARVYYDYNNSSYDEYLITGASPYQFNIHLKRQKCEALRIELYDNGTGRSMDLTGLTLEVGVKMGTMKLPATRKY